MNTVVRTIASGLALLIPLSAVADDPAKLKEAEADACDINEIRERAKQRLATGEATGPREAEAVDNLVQNAGFYQSPRKTANALNDTPSGGNGMLGALVSGAWNPAVLGLAIDSGLVSESGGAYSVSVTPFAWFALLDPTVNTDPAKYMDLDWARRISGKVTLGGKGEAFDRDGDGTVDEALEAGQRSDIVTYELAWRFRGSRDRLDRRSPAIVQAALQSFRKQNSELIASSIKVDEQTIGNSLLDECGAPADVRLTEKNCECLVDRITDEHAAKLVEFDSARQAATDEAIRKIDSQWLWSVVASGTQREAAYGGDKRALGIRGSFGIVGDKPVAGTHHDFELDFVRNELATGTLELKGWKLGYKFSKPVELDYGSGAKATVLSLAGAVEKYSDVPTDAKDSIAKLQIKWSVPISEGVKVPLSLTWANRTELLADEGDVVAHLGFTIDFDAFKSFGTHE